MIYPNVDHQLYNATITWGELMDGNIININQHGLWKINLVILTFFLK